MDPYLGEIRMFGGGFAPHGWHLCDGTLLSIEEHSALFSLIGAEWGGDGRTNFAVPDLRGRIPVGQGAGAGLTPRTLGQTGGTEMVTLVTGQLPAHNHLANATASVATTSEPGAAVNLAATNPSTSENPTAIYLKALPTPAVRRVLDDSAVGSAGKNAAHDNVMPSFALTFIICLNGTYPLRP